MNPWSFVTAAYVVALVAVALLIGWAWLSMRRAESAVEDLKKTR